MRLVGEAISFSMALPSRYHRGNDKYGERDKTGQRAVAHHLMSLRSQGAPLGVGSGWGGGMNQKMRRTQTTESWVISAEPQFVELSKHTSPSLRRID
jgi:hypothetical protein